MLFNQKIKLNLQLTSWLLSAVVPAIALFTPLKPVKAIPPESSPFACPIQREFRPSEVAGNDQRIQFQIETPAGRYRRIFQKNGEEQQEFGDIPPTTFTLTLERDRKSKQVIVSTSQGHSIAIQSSAPLSSVKVWMAELDRPEIEPHTSEIMVSLPERKHSANTAVPHALLVFSDTQADVNGDRSQPWTVFSLKSVSTDPQQDFMTLSGPEVLTCSLVTAQSATIANRSYWFYQVYRGSNLRDDSRVYPLYLAQTGAAADRTTPLERPRAERILGRFIDRSPQLTATVESVEAGSRFGEAQITVKNQKNERLRVVPTDMVYICTEDPTFGLRIPNSIDSGRVQALKKQFAFVSKPVKIYGMQSLPDGRAIADLIVVERQCNSAPQLWRVD